MSRRHPTAPQRSTTARESAPMSEFSWQRCGRHAWLGVSVLTVRGQAPLCLPHEGTPHLVDPAELRRAAA